MTPAHEAGCIASGPRDAAPCTEKRQPSVFECPEADFAITQSGPDRRYNRISRPDRTKQGERCPREPKTTVRLHESYRISDTLSARNCAMRSVWRDKRTAFPRRKPSPRAKPARRRSRRVSTRRHRRCTGASTASFPVRGRVCPPGRTSPPHPPRNAPNRPARPAPYGM